MRRITGVLTSVVLASALSFGAGVSAQASTGNAADCDARYACIFGDTNYVGYMYGSLYTVADLVGGWDNMASSALSRGQSCNLRVYEYKDITGKFVEFGLSSQSELYADYNLADGIAAYGACKGENWDNRISSWKFVTPPVPTTAC